MSLHQETNPHFLPPQRSRHPTQHPHPQHAPDHFPIHQQPGHSQPQQGSDHFPLHPQQRHQNQLPQEQHGLPLHPQKQPLTQRQDPHSQGLHSPRRHSPTQPPPQRQNQYPQSQHGSGILIPTPRRPQHLDHETQPERHPSSSLIVPQPRKTKPIAWFIAVFCALFWIVIIVGGLAILIVYLLFRPRSPKFDVSSATLNAAYLDMGYLLNSDLTLLANFTNPNKKVKVDFNYMIINIYHENILLATRYIEPFTNMNAGSKLADVHLVTSQVPLSIEHSQQLRRQMENNRIKFEVKGLFRTRSDLGSFLRYSYWLYGHCTIVMTGPPSGILVAKRCQTKR